MNSDTPPDPTAPRSAVSRRGFTLVELLVTIAIIALVISLGTVSFKKLFNSNAVQTAVSTITSNLAIARAYAIENQIETLLVVNPVNGRLEIWRANPQLGTSWDPLSRGRWDTPSPGAPAAVDGFKFVPLLDAGAALPLDSDKKPLVVVHPADFGITFPPNGVPMRSVTGPPVSDKDNFNWVMFAFDESGRMVIRARRIATRLAATPWSLAPDGSPWYSQDASHPNRLADGTVDDGRVASGSIYAYHVDKFDSLITSTTSYIVSDRKAFVQKVGINPTIQNVRGLWLNNAVPGRAYSQYAQTVVLGIWSGAPMATVE